MKESTMTPKTKSEETAREIAERIWSHESDLQDEIADEIEIALRERDEKVEKYESVWPPDSSITFEGIADHIADLRAKLAEADNWMEHKPRCAKLWHDPENEECTCGLDAFKASLTTLGGKGE